jgi:hypothetical protein
MAAGKRAVRGGGAGRGRPGAAIAVAERGSGAAADSLSADQGGGEPQAVRGVWRSDAAAGHGELADVREPADLRPGVRGKARSSKALVAPLRVPGGILTGTTLNDILPRDLSKVTREDMAEALIHLAKQSEKMGNPVAAAQIMTNAAKMMGHFEEPEAEAAPVDPEELKRKICLAAESYGMRFPEVKDG